MERLKTTTRKWIILLGLSVPIFITSALYLTQTLTLPVPRIVTIGNRLGRARDAPSVDLILHHAHSKSNRSSAISTASKNPAHNVTLSVNASHGTHDERTLNSDPTALNIQNDVFVYSKQSLDKQNGGLISGVAAEKDAGNQTFSIVINNGGMVVEDIPAKNPSGEKEELAPDPLVKDLSGYTSVINIRNHLYANCSSCAYVSSSGQLRGTNAGEVIDSYPCVFRMNNAPTKGFETDVGSKTTFRVVAHSAIKGVHSKRASLLKGSGSPKFLVVWGPKNQMATNGKGGTYNILASLSKEFSKDGMQAFVFSQQQIDYADKTFEMETGRNRITSGSWLSTGWFTMLLSRGVCQEITVFGMVTEDHCKRNPNSKVPYHYYQATSTRECSMYNSNEKAKKNGHRFMTEKGVFARWSKLNPKISFRNPDWSAWTGDF